MTDITTDLTPDDLERQARETYLALKAELEGALAELEAEPAPRTPMSDKLQRQLQEEQDAVAEARREKNRQRAALMRQLNEARDAWAATLEKAAEMKRKAEREANEAAVLEFAKGVLNRDKATVETPQERAALKLRQLTGLPIKPGDLHHQTFVGGATFLGLSYHGLHCLVIDTVDEPAQLWSALPAAGGRIIQDARDLVTDCLRAKISGPESGFAAHHRKSCWSCNLDYGDA